MTVCFASTVQYCSVPYHCRLLPCRSAATVERLSYAVLYCTVLRRCHRPICLSRFDPARHLSLTQKDFLLPNSRERSVSLMSPRLRELHRDLAKMHAAAFSSSTLTTFHNFSAPPSHLPKCRSSVHHLIATASNSQSPNPSSLEAEIAQAARERRCYNIDKSKLTPKERQELRLRSKAIPLVVDNDPLDVIFEDANFLVVNKPAYLKMHPSHRFEGGSLLNRAIGYCGFMPYILHRIDMVRAGAYVCLCGEMR